MELGSVYLIETDNRALVKIGFTTKLMMRFRQLQALSLPWMGTDIRLVGFFPASRDVETSLHRRFAEFRAHGDWYHYGPVMRQFSTVVIPAVEPTEMPGASGHLNPHAVALGRNGGKARKEALTPKQRSEIARKAINTRWDRARKVKRVKASKNGTVKPSRN